MTSQTAGYEPMLSQPEPVLCLIENEWAWFTTQPLDQQTGDDWNDAPYEHNAGSPYEWRDGDLEKYGVKPYRIIKVAWEGPFLLPEGYSANSHYSIDQINRGDIAWLRPEFAPDGVQPIHAGIKLSEFIRQIKAAGGEVYLAAPEGEQ